MRVKVAGAARPGAARRAACFRDLFGISCRCCSDAPQAHGASMPKTTLPFDSGAYAPVADRIALFYERHPTGRIVTELVERGEVVVFRALVYRSAEDTSAAATGWASERVGDGEINAVACVENTETSAIGRALANLGFTASSRRPSAEEMEKAARERGRLTRERQSRGWDSSTPTVRLETSRSRRVVSEPRSASSPAHPET